MRVIDAINIREWGARALGSLRERGVFKDIAFCRVWYWDLAIEKLCSDSAPDESGMGIGDFIEDDLANIKQVLLRRSSPSVLLAHYIANMLELVDYAYSQEEPALLTQAGLHIEGAARIRINNELLKDIELSLEIILNDAGADRPNPIYMHHNMYWYIPMNGRLINDTVMAPINLIERRSLQRDVEYLSSVHPALNEDKIFIEAYASILKYYAYYDILDAVDR